MKVTRNEVRVVAALVVAIIWISGVTMAQTEPQRMPEGGASNPVRATGQRGYDHPG